MRYLAALFLLFTVLLTVFSCEPEEEVVTRNPAEPLQFSTDTIQFDTVFVIDPTYSKNTSVTKRLVVYNFNKNAVLIDEVKLQNSTGSPYKITINGKPTVQTQDIRILGNDSLLVLIELFVPPGTDNKAFEVKDILSFRLNNLVQNIQLIAKGQNAVFYRDQVMACNTTWTGEKPHVIFGKLQVNVGCKLIIEKGARIYLHKDAFIQVDGTLQVNGTDKDRVIFDGDRLERFYDEIAGQWKGIQFSGSSQNSYFRYTHIKNANTAITIFNSDRTPNTVELRLENCVIKNMFTAGIASVGADVQVVNSLITNCGQVAVSGLGGGTYTFIYTTIANFHTPEFKRELPSFSFSDEYTEGSQRLVSPLNIRMVNSILWAGKKNSKLTEEMSISKAGGTDPVLEFSNNILQTERFKTLPGNNIFNEDPLFRSTPADARPVLPYNYTLRELSPASGRALPITGISIDLLSTPRDLVSPDIGAYERLLP